jgi:hypothetical protein
VMEGRFARDFGNVRIHSGPRAAASALSIRARAFTIGRHIVVGALREEPDIGERLWLLAHELAHVIQQEAGEGVVQADAKDVCKLERRADLAADIVARGDALPAAFAFGTSPYGSIQRHMDEPCRGTPISARERHIYMAANQAIENAYKNAHAAHAEGIFTGTDFDRGEISLPKGAPNKKFGDLLLPRLRGLVKQLRPDIIDFVKLNIYEIKSVDRADDGPHQLAKYYDTTDLIRREYAMFNQEPWKVEYATWYPPHVLAFPTDPLGKIVCTQATDYTLRRGVILYDVRELNRRRRRQRPAVRYQLQAFEPNYTDLAPFVRAKLPKSIPFYDPESPDYIIIVPRGFFKLDYVRLKANKEWDKVRMKLPFFADMHQAEAAAVRISWLIIMALVSAEAGGLAIAAASSVGVGAGAVVTASVASEAGAGAGAAAGGIEVVLGYEVGAATLPESTIVVPSAITTQLAGGTAAAAGFQSLLVAPATKAAAALAGAVLVLGNPRRASASTSPGPAITLDGAVSMRAVPATDFVMRAGGLEGSSSGHLSGFGVSSAAIGQHFVLGKMVLYDGEPHFVLGRFTVS